MPAFVDELLPLLLLDVDVAAPGPVRDAPDRVFEGEVEAEPATARLIDRVDKPSPPPTTSELADPAKP